MDFFKTFAQFAKDLERELKELNERTENDGRLVLTEEEKEERRNSAIVVSQNLQRDVKSSKREVKQLMDSVQDDGGFSEMVELSETFIKKQAKVVDNIEQHLKQYGYQPLHKEGLNLTQKKKGAMNPLLPSNEKDTESCTPENKCIKSFDDIKTPKLEDFGLTKDLWDHYAKMGAGKSDEIKESNLLSAKETNSSSAFSNMITQGTDAGEHNNWNRESCTQTPIPTHGETLNVPKYPEVVSEGNEGERISMVTPQLVRSKEYLQTKKESKTNDLDSTIEIPSPPVLTTPGIKQFAKPNYQNMASLNPASNQRLSLEIESPIPPVLETPGVKQITKPVKRDLQNLQSDLISKFNLDEDDFQSPVPPVLLTAGLQQINKTNMQNVNDSKVKALDADEKIESPIPPIMCTPGVKPLAHSIKPTICESLIIDKYDEPKTPEMPELTFSMGDLQAIIAQCSTNQTNFNSCKTDCNNGVTNEPIPPKLTGTYNYNATHNKENRVPYLQESKFNSCLVNRKGTRIIEYITSEEYNTQPDYVQSIISLQLLNHTIDKMEVFFTKTNEDPESDCFITEETLYPLLGAKTKSVLLAMKRLGRLRPVPHKGQNSYVPAQ